jgi:hypothetical protein
LNESVPLQGERYRILNTSSTTTVSKDTYLNRLVVQHTKRDDSGLYVCLAANKMGYSFRKAFLTVEPSTVLSPVATSESIFVNFFRSGCLTSKMSRIALSRLLITYKAIYNEIQYVGKQFDKVEDDRS